MVFGFPRKTGLSHEPVGAFSALPSESRWPGVARGRTAVADFSSWVSVLGLCRFVSAPLAPEIFFACASGCCCAAKDAPGSSATITPHPNIMAIGVKGIEGPFWLTYRRFPFGLPGRPIIYFLTSLALRHVRAIPPAATKRLKQCGGIGITI